jgi:hypothetical protein
MLVHGAITVWTLEGKTVVDEDKAGDQHRQPYL